MPLSLSCQPPKSRTENWLFSDGLPPACRSPRVSDTSPVVPNLAGAGAPSDEAAPAVVPNRYTSLAGTCGMMRTLSSLPPLEWPWWEKATPGGRVSEEETKWCCLLMEDELAEGSPSAGALASPTLRTCCVCCCCCCCDGGGGGDCALWRLVSPFSLSSPSSLNSCWYMSSTMGFHRRTRALMNQLET